MTAVGLLKIRRASAALIRVTSAVSRHGPSWVSTRSSPSGGMSTSLPPLQLGATVSRVCSGPTAASSRPPASSPSQQPTSPISTISATGPRSGSHATTACAARALRGDMRPAYPINLSQRQNRPVLDMTEDRFEELVSEALDTVPPELAALMDNVAVFVEDEPPPTTPTCSASTRARR